VNEFLKSNFRYFSYSELKSKLNEMRYSGFSDKDQFLQDKMKEGENILLELKHKEELEKLINKKFSIKEEIKGLEIEKNNLRRKEITRKLLVKENLNLEENKVFEKGELNKEEIEILLESRYKQVNEYCVFKEKIITVLVKPPQNHSVTHAFLVWSVKKLLKEYEIIEKIIEHETRDADLTFKVKGKIFAVEIETGTLLRKKKQLREKIGDLNLKYKNRWLIVVSNRNLVKKYEEFGPCTQRKWVKGEIAKILEF